MDKKPFEAGKTAKEETLLGYDLGSVDGDTHIALYGFRKEDGTVEITRRVLGLPLNKQEAYKPMVDDRISMEGYVHTIGSGYFSVVFDGSCHPIEPVVFEDDEIKHVKLLSRKAYTLTKPEAEAILTEKLGERIIIE